MAAGAKDCPVLSSGAGKIAWQMQDLSTWGAAANATLAAAEEGRALLDDSGRQLAALLQEVDRLPLDTLNASTA